MTDEDGTHFDEEESVLSEAAHKLKAVFGAAGMSAVLAEALASSGVLARIFGVSAAFSHGFAYLAGGVFFIAAVILETYLERRSRTDRSRSERVRSGLGMNRGG